MRSDRNIPMRGKPSTLEATIFNDLIVNKEMVVVGERKEMEGIARLDRNLGGFCSPYLLRNDVSIHRLAAFMVLLEVIYVKNVV